MYVVKSLECLRSLSEEFNQWSGNVKINKPSQASSNLIKFLMQLIYNRAVLDPEKLNHYEPFSPQVYGETSYDLIEEMLNRVKNLKETDIFMDLGSGMFHPRLLFSSVVDRNFKTYFGMIEIILT